MWMTLITELSYRRECQGMIIGMESTGGNGRRSSSHKDFKSKGHGPGRECAESRCFSGTASSRWRDLKEFE